MVELCRTISESGRGRRNWQHRATRRVLASARSSPTLSSRADSRDKMKINRLEMRRFSSVPMPEQESRWSCLGMASTTQDQRLEVGRGRRSALVRWLAPTAPPQPRRLRARGGAMTALFLRSIGRQIRQGQRTRAALLALVLATGPPLCAQSAGPPVWVLDRTVLSSADREGRLPPGLASPGELGFTYIAKLPDGTSASSSIEWSAPPPTIPHGSTVTLTLTTSGNPALTVSGWWNFSDYGVTAGWQGVRSVNNYEAGVPRSGSLTFRFEPFSSSEAWIQVSAGHDPNPDQWYLVTWVYTKRAPGATSSASDPITPDELPDACQEELDAWREAAMRAKFTASHLEACRAAIQELDQQWEDTRESGFWSGAIDVAFLGGALWTKPLLKVPFLRFAFGAYTS